STVPRAQLEAALGGQNNGLGPGQPGVAAPGAPGGIPTTGTIPNAGSTGPGALVPGAAGGTLGPGITKDTIYVGAVYLTNAAAANSALAGAAGTDPGDFRRVYDTVIAQINKEGGIAGRKIVPIYAEFDVTSSRTIDQQAQSACAKWTQDNKVFAIVAGVQGGVVQECTEKARAVNIVGGAGSSLPDDFRRYPHYVEVSGMNLVRMGSVAVSGLKAQNYFDPGAKLGIVTWDDRSYKTALEDGFIPALEKAGAKLATQPAYIHVPQSFNDLGGMNSGVNSAVLRFASSGITHVMIIDGSAGVCAGACLGYQFLNQAESQRYRPRYGFNEYNYADSSVGELYPASQLVRSVAVVWSDDQASDDVGWRPNPAREACYKLMRDNGVPMENDNQTASVRAACEQLWFLRAVVAKMGNAVLNNDNFMAAVNTMGTSFQPLNTYLSRLSASQHDGASAVRNQAFFESCTCYQYTSNPYLV
ncbi:MAG: ABC transporter substrate-binding protein, partial [Actinomycetota bacterium]